MSKSENYTGKYALLSAGDLTFRPEEQSCGTERREQHERNRLKAGLRGRLHDPGRSTRRRPHPCH